VSEEKNYLFPEAAKAINALETDLKAVVYPPVERLLRWIVRIIERNGRRKA